nr:hypothetical protein [Tanacetum cinerariifolium]
MGYEKLPPKLMFYKAFFSAQWKFLINTLVQCISAKRTAWNEFSCSMMSAVICLATGRKFNFSKYIFDNMVRNVDSPSNFLMYPRFLQVIINAQVEDLLAHSQLRFDFSYSASLGPRPGCALLRKKFKEDLFTYCIKNGILQNSSEPSNDNNNIINALQEPFVVEQDPGAHYGYNCPPKVLVVLDPERFNKQNDDELPQTVPSFDPTCYSEDGNSFTYDSTSNLIHESPNVFDPPLQPPIYSYEFCGNDAYYGYDCSLQVPFTYDPEPCYNQDFNFPQNFQLFQQQYLCCTRCGGPYETCQCDQLIFDELL